MTNAEDIIHDILHAYSNGTELLNYDTGGSSNLAFLDNKLREICDNYLYNGNSTRFMADLCNVIAYHITSAHGRGAQILLGSVDDLTFLNLKNFEDHTMNSRSTYGSMSNNSVTPTGDTIKNMEWDEINKIVNKIEGKI